MKSVGVTMDVRGKDSSANRFPTEVVDEEHSVYRGFLSAVLCNLLLGPKDDEEHPGGAYRGLLFAILFNLLLLLCGVTVWLLIR
jgi:hypothetical protein